MIKKTVAITRTFCGLPVLSLAAFFAMKNFSDEIFQFFPQRILIFCRIPQILKSNKDKKSSTYFSSVDNYLYPSFVP